MLQEAAIPRDRYLAAAMERLDISYLRADFNGTTDLKSPMRIQKRCRDFRPDILLAHSAEALRILPEALAVRDIPLLPLTFLAEENPEPLRREDAATPENSFLTGIMADFSTDVNLIPLLRALRQIPDAFLWIAGEGPGLAGLQSSAEDEGVSARVRFLGRQINRSAFLNALDVCIVPPQDSRRPIFESWAAGCPVLSILGEAPVPSIHGRTAFHVRTGKEKPFSAALETLIRNKALRKRLAEGGLRAYAENAAPEILAPQYRTFFRQIVAQRHHQATG